MKTKKLLKQICAVLLGLVLSVSQIPVTGYIPVSAYAYVATVTYGEQTQEFGNFEDAIAKLKENSGSTLKLLKDVTIPERIVFSDANTYTIDFNGYGIMQDEYDTVIYAASGSTVNLKDSRAENILPVHYIILNNNGCGIAVSEDEPEAGTDYVMVTGGYITGGTGYMGFGGAIFATEDCTVNIENINIVGNVADNGGGVYIKESTFTMTGGEISNNTAEINGGGVYVEESSFTMTGGEISNNTAKAGGGVYVYHDLNESDKNATFTLTGGKITGNKAEYSSSVSNSGVGGGVYGKNASITMNGGEISGNTSGYVSEDSLNKGTGGGVFIDNTDFTMTNGKIFENSAENGGGVFVWDAAFIMTGGEISENRAYQGGGVDVYHDLSESDKNATFTMHGGKIIKNKAEYLSSAPNSGQGGGVYGLNAIIIIDGGAIGGEISENRAYQGGGVYNKNTVFSMTGGKIAGNTADDAGGGVFGLLAVIYIDGGEISGNTAKAGGGIFGNGTAITMKEGEISGNTATAGGGIYGYANGTSITLEEGGNGGKLAGNTATIGGGIFVGENGIFTMKGGKITGNKAEYDAVSHLGGEGGGVYDYSGKTGTMTGGEISENTALNGGGVFIKNDNTEFAMSGGKITGNEAVYNENLQTLPTGEGGGVTVSDSATFTMTGGEITENAAGCGGGVNVGYSPIGQGATFKMTAGIISKNTAEDYGGVYVGGVINVSSGVAVIGDPYCTFIMEGGEISGNSAKNDNGGVGVYGSILKIIGNVSIKDNKLIKTDDTEEDSNLLVGAECEFSISGELTGNIGASLKKLDVDLGERFLANGELATAEGSYNISADDAKVFTSDNEYYTVVLKNDGKLYYEKSFVVAKIPAMRYTEEALVPDVSVSGISGELTENTDYTVTISQSGEATTPINPGKYSVEVTGTGVEYYGTVTTEFEVKKRENKITKNPVANDFVEDGTEKALLTAGTADGGTFKYAVTTTEAAPDANAYGDTVPTAKEAGTYYVWYKVDGGEFYESIKETCVKVTVSVQNSSGNGAITKKSITPEVKISGWTEGEAANVPEISGNEGNGTVTVEYKVTGADDSTYTGTVPTSAGNYTVRISIAETENYKAGTATAEFTVKAREADSNGSNGSNVGNGGDGDVSGNGEDINNTTDNGGSGNSSDSTDDYAGSGSSYSGGGYSGGGYVSKPADNNYAVVINESIADKKDESKDGDSKDNAGKDNTVKDNDKPKDQNQVGNNEPQVTEVVSNDGKSETVERITSFENGDKLQESTTVKETKKGTVTVAESKLTNKAGDVIEESKSKIRENDDVTISSSKTVNYESGVVESTYQKNSENVSIDRVKQTDLNGELIKKTEEVVKQLYNGVRTKDTVWKANGSMKRETVTIYLNGTGLVATYNLRPNGKANYSRVKTDASGEVISEVACKVSAKGNATITTKTADADGNLVIPNTLKINGDKHPVTGVAANAFANNTDITSAVIGANVTKIGDGAFAGAINLEKITFKGKTVDIGEDAFKGVNNLTVDVQLKNDVATSEEIRNLINKLVEEIMGKSYGW